MNRTNPTHARTNERRGMALFAAIALLAVFALLGTAYVGYMMAEFEDAGVQLHRTRARTLAGAGVYAAIGEIQAALDNGRAPEPSYNVTLSTYRREQGGAGAYPQQVAVTVSDESARVDLNSASALLLQAMGLDQAAAEKLAEMRNEQRALASVDALRTEDVVGAQEFDALDTSDFTVHSEGRLNINTASPRVLAAAFGISEDEAAALAKKRPFTDWADALQKIGREPTTFNLDVAAFAPREIPRGVALDSRSFRVLSAATLNMPGGDHRPVYAAVEAVVAIAPDGGYAIRSWRELRGADARVAGEGEPNAPVPAEPAGEVKN